MRGSVLAAVALVLAVMMLSVGATACPSPPNSCRSVIDPVTAQVGSSAMNVGVYKEDPAAGEGGTAAMRVQSGHEGFHAGDRGGVLIIVRDPGEASRLDFAFTAGSNQIDWEGSDRLTIEDPVADGYYLLPFTAGSPAFAISFTIRDDGGNETSGEITILDLAATLRDAPAPSVIVVIGTGLVLTWAVRRSR